MIGFIIVTLLSFGVNYLINYLLIQIEEKNHRINNKTLIIGTGGFTSIYRNADIFDEIIPDLVLKGLFIAYQLNNS